MKKYMYLGIMIGLLTPLLFVTQRAEATFSITSYYCHNNNGVKTTMELTSGQAFGHTLHGHPTTPGVCPSPTPTPTPTPTLEPTPTPTPVDECKEDCCEGECQEPTPTPTIRVEQPPQVNTGPSFSAAVASPPQCTGTPPDAPIATGGTRVDDDTVQVRWYRSLSPVHHYSLVYGMSPESLVWGVPFIDPVMDHYELNHVPQGHVWYRVTAESAEYCVAHSTITDP